MKNKLLLALCFLLIGLVACTNEAPEPNASAKESPESEVDENEVKDGPLIEVNQWSEEDDGTIVTLKKVMLDERVLDLDPIEMTIHDVKLLERSGGNDDGNVIQVSFTVENTSDKEVMFNGINKITTDTKRQIDVSLLDVHGEASTGEYYGEVIQEGFITVPYPGESFDDLSSIKLITNDVWNNDKPEKYHDAITEDIEFD